MPLSSTREQIIELTGGAHLLRQHINTSDSSSDTDNHAPSLPRPHLILNEYLNNPPFAEAWPSSLSTNTSSDHSNPSLSDSEDENAPTAALRYIKQGQEMRAKKGLSSKYRCKRFIASVLRKRVSFEGERVDKTSGSMQIVLEKWRVSNNISNVHIHSPYV